MTNKSMIGKNGDGDRAPESSRNESPPGSKTTTNEGSPDSPQLKPELDEPRTGLQKPAKGRPQDP